ncbi:oxalurate catabolism protein HpxZ [Roseiarcaceae bacterium H3SJ34-1]|uniref:oxalurate catabolism protein HpxZ n=1 Tax=Terripilifer ovatus TaxID=3032367 RepID=UPI003AB93FCA|nr:oxalurate catabolism protein HpxZ [Roseiarcaceae bacterium H3SJ34-1]
MIEETNHPDVVAEVKTAFQRYNEAIETGDVDTLNALFWNSPLTVRFGPTEHLFGYGEISTFRAGTWKRGPARVIERLAITALGKDVATTNALFRLANGKITRQSQTWARVPEGWRIVAAHVSPFPG